MPLDGVFSFDSTQVPCRCECDIARYLSIRRASRPVGLMNQMQFHGNGTRRGPNHKRRSLLERLCGQTAPVLSWPMFYGAKQRSIGKASEHAPARPTVPGPWNERHRGKSKRITTHAWAWKASRGMLRGAGLPNWQLPHGDMQVGALDEIETPRGHSFLYSADARMTMALCGAT